MTPRPLRTPRERVGTLPNADLPPPARADGRPEDPLHRALLERDPRALREAVRDLEPDLLRAARFHVRSHDDAQDVVQDTWMAALRGIPRFEGRAALKTWLFRILSYRARSQARRADRCVPFSELGLDADLLPGPALLQRPSPSPDALLAASELRRGVAEALQGVPRRQRAVFRLRDVEGLSPEEVCHRLEVTGANQRVLLHRARARIRRHLGAEHGPGAPAAPLA